MRTPLSLVLLVALLLPTLPLYVGLASSMALGASAAAVFAIGVAWWKVRSNRQVSTRFSPGVVASFAVLAVAAHGLVLALQDGPFDVTRAGASIAPLMLMLLGGSAIARLFTAASTSEVDRALRAAFGVLCIVGIVGVLGIAPPAALPRGKPVFPFTEPSHFALVFVPLLMYRCVTATGRHRFLYLLGGVAIALLFQNLTLAVGCVLIAAISLRPYVLLGSIALFALAVSQIDLTYYAERLDLSGESQNLSNLVYLQGWQLINESLSNSQGWGLGFQQLGVHGTSVGAAYLIQALLGEPSNLLDGGFTVAKLLSEFGIFGAVLLVTYVVVAARSVLALRRRVGGPAVTFAHCTIVGYSLDLFVRGAGYFSAGALLMISASWLLATTGRRLRLRAHVLANAAPMVH